MKYFVIWTTICLTLFGLTLTGILLAQQAKNQNDIQDLKIRILQNNVTYLTILEQIIATNITEMEVRISNIETNIIVAWSDIQIIESDILVLYNYTNVTFGVLATIHSNLTAIDLELQAQHVNLTSTYNASLVLDQLIIESNAVLLSLVDQILQTIQNVSAVNHNIDLLGQCGVIVYPSMTPDTVDIDTSAIQGQIDALTVSLNDTIFELFKQIIMSNTTIAQVNYQYPIFGDILLQSGNTGVTIGGYSNIINIGNNAITSINNITALDGNPSFNLQGGFGISVNTAAPSTILLNNTITTYITQVTSPGGLDISSNGPRSLLIENTFAKRVGNSDNTSYTCNCAFTYSGATVIYKLGQPVSFLATCVPTHNCKYFVSGSNGISLSDPNATYLIQFKWETLTRKYLSLTLYPLQNIYEEYWYCIGELNCAQTGGGGATWNYVKRQFSRMSNGASVYAARILPMAQTFVVTYQTGSAPVQLTQFLSMAWRYNALYLNPPTYTDVGFSFTDFKGSVHVQRIG